MDMDDTISDSLSSVSSVESILDTMLTGDINDDNNLQSGGFSISSELDETYTLYICIAVGILIFSNLRKDY